MSSNGAKSGRTLVIIMAATLVSLATWLQLQKGMQSKSQFITPLKSFRARAAANATKVTRGETEALALPKRASGSRLGIYSYCNGRLGNQLSNLATLYAIKQKLPVEPLILRKQFLFLSDFMDAPSGLPPIVEDIFPNYPNETISLSKYNTSLVRGQKITEQLVVMPPYPNDMESFVQYIPELKEKFFRFRHPLVTAAQAEIALAKKNFVERRKLARNEQITLIGVHIRRTDYVRKMTRMKLRQITADYFQRAFDMMRNTKKNTLFLVVGDDVDWAKTNLKGSNGDIFIPSQADKSYRKTKRQGNPNIGRDMAILSLSQHHILTLGTFGMWGLLLSNMTGDIIKPDGYTLVRSEREFRATGLNITYI